MKTKARTSRKTRRRGGGNQTAPLPNTTSNLPAPELAPAPNTTAPLAANASKPKFSFLSPSTWSITGGSRRRRKRSKRNTRK